jgi:hypothetical protein
MEQADDAAMLPVDAVMLPVDAVMLPVDAVILPVDAVIFPEKPPVYFGKTMPARLTREYIYAIITDNER